MLQSATHFLGRAFWLAAMAASAAACLPALLAYNVSPSPTFLNQALAAGLWGGFVVVCIAGAAKSRADDGSLGRVGEGLWPLLGALGLLVAAALGSSLFGALPSSLALSALAVLLAATVLCVGGAAARQMGGTRLALGVFVAFCIGWVVCGVLNVGVAVVQVFAPDAADGHWIARSGIAGRAVGNLRQPNHLSSLLVWSAVAVVALQELRCLGARWGAALLALMVFGVVLSGSRTGMVSVLLLAVWALADRRLARSTRAPLVLAPGVYALGWWAVSRWVAAAQHSVGDALRLSADRDFSSSRFGIWSNTLDLIRAQPWTGVGFGEFNFAWSLTPFPGRPVAFFDHTHNLELQLLVELGLPLTLAIVGLLVLALWRSGRQAWRETGPLGPALRCAWVMVLMIGLHSQLEYPLWYTYFLLPCAWLWGFGIAAQPASWLAGDTASTAASGPRSGRLLALQVAGSLLVVGSAASVLDYGRVTDIFTSREGAPPLEQRIAEGQRSLLFAHHAHYADATISQDPQRVLKSLHVAGHFLLDTRLMVAWARAWERVGDENRARHLGARLREFRNPDATEYFAPCGEGADPAWVPPEPCRPPQRVMGWWDFSGH